MHHNVNPALYTELQEKKLLIKQMQPPTFRGEETGLEKAAESWIEQMDDYFTAAGTVASNKAMLGMFKLAGEAKLWWKQNCKDPWSLRSISNLGGHKDGREGALLTAWA